MESGEPDDMQRKKISPAPARLLSHCSLRNSINFCGETSGIVCIATEKQFWQCFVL